LKSAQRPVIIAGGGLWWSDAAAELTRFIELTSIPLYTISLARGVVSDEHPMCMGYADPALNHAVQQIFREADLFLILGKRVDFRLAFGGPRLFPPDARFVQVDIHPQELGYNRDLELGVCADLKLTLRALLDGIGDSPWPVRPWLGRARAAQQQWREKLEQAASDRSTPIHPAALYAEVKRSLPPDVLYSWDGGDFVHWGRAILPAMKPGGWIRLGPMGTIGAALPNAVALQLANPGQPVVLITGDGSLGFYIAELDTAVRHKLPIVIIVGNDAGWGLERELQTRSSPEGSVACELRATRYDLIMQGFGGGGETVDTLDQIGPALDRAFASGVPYCINVNVRGARSPFTEWQLQGKT
jgi:acetolactate synthase-1/2/3 large subunit